uniref:TIGR03826 family flagellar region protein n=1 Tax=uncultured Allobacillus sp. TaxID=1638025 RepID=UPI002598C248|nr:TIGR03826 family flagellar region protein [uncultured Allobacillus sp.]
MGELANCPMCGELFLKGILTVCRSCYEKEEEQFETVYKFIRKKKNRTATIDEVAEATGVKIPLIQKWVKERRIHRADFPNLTYSCERCDEQIQEGKLCDSCKNELYQDLQASEEPTIAEKVKEEKKSDIYYNVTKDRTWRS